MLVSKFTRMVEKRGMHWEQERFFITRLIKVSGPRQCASSSISLSDIQSMSWLEAWRMLRNLQKRDAFEADFAGLQETSKQESEPEPAQDVMEAGN